MRRFCRDLRRLNEALRRAPIRDQYWVWAGLLLGWAREGGVLGHDLLDADFAFLSSDRDLFVASIPIIIAAGFAPLFRFRNNDGAITQYTFGRHGASFDFLELEPR